MVFMYVNRFSEIRDLPPLQQMELLEHAERKISKLALFAVLPLLLLLAILIGVVPGEYYELSWFYEGLLATAALGVTTALYRRYYLYLLHSALREVLDATR